MRKCGRCGAPNRNSRTCKAKKKLGTDHEGRNAREILINDPNVDLGRALQDFDDRAKDVVTAVLAMAQAREKIMYCRQVIARAAQERIRQRDSDNGNLGGISWAIQRKD